MTPKWHTKTLGEVCLFINRGISPKYLSSGGILVLNQKCVRDHKVNIDLGRRHDIEAKKVKNERLVIVGDVLVNSTGTGTLGRVAQVIEKVPEPTTVDSHVTIVRPNPDIFYLPFFGYLMIGIEEKIKNSGEGASGQTELSRKTLESEFLISFPISKHEQEKICSKLIIGFHEINKSKEILENQKSLLEELRNSILAKSLQCPE